MSPKVRSFRSILFVDSTNIIRSPAAAAYFLRETQRWGQKWKIASAGTHAKRGQQPNPAVAFLMLQKGMSLAGHKSQLVDRKLMKGFDWIFAMEHAQYKSVLAVDPSVADRLYVLGEFGSHSEFNVPDIGELPSDGLNKFRTMLDILEIEIPRIFRCLEDRISNLEMELT